MCMFVMGYIYSWIFAYSLDPKSRIITETNDRQIRLKKIVIKSPAFNRLVIAAAATDQVDSVDILVSG